jgi:Iap family predicted aminopeptidase
MSKRSLVVLVAVFLLALLLPAAAQAMTYDQAVDKLVADGYPQRVEKAIVSMGTSGLGFRWAGSPSDNAAAHYIAAQMHAIGLSGVRLEKVPLDVWSFHGARVRVNGRSYVASGFAGARGTGGMPVTGEVVYVGLGTLEEFEAAGDVTGKIVLVDFDGYDWWLNFPQMLAGYRGARAVVFTHAPYDFDSAGEYFSLPDALGSFDAESDYSAPPAVYISRADGAELRAACEAGSVKATVKADIRVRLQRNGGFGYNVVGMIRGRGAAGHNGKACDVRSAEQMIVVSAHHDAHFRGAEDDTSAVATALTMAKAMKMSHARPDKTVAFLMVTGEEFGTTDSWYDWLIGSYHAITKTHRDWVGRVAAQINLEWQGSAGAPLQVRLNPEMAPYVQGLLDAHPELLPNGVDNGGLVRRNVWTWNDQWTFTAAGVPSVYFVTKDTTYRGAWYHTQYDTMDLIDWSYLDKNAKLYGLLQQGLDAGVLPYDFGARAAQFAEIVDAAVLTDAGASSAAVDQLTASLDAFTAASAAWSAGSGGVPARDARDVNRKLIRAEKVLNRSLTALDQWDSTTYPHVQVLDDVSDLNAAIAELDAAVVDAGAAQGAVSGVGPMYYGLYFGQQVYERQLARQQVEYRRINWGRLGHLEDYPNVWPAWAAIGDGDYAGARASIVAMRDELLADLDAALVDEAAALDRATAILTRVTP